MNKNYIYIFAFAICFLCSSKGIFSQNISPELFNSQYLSLSAGTTVVEFSAGEVFVSTFSNSNNIYTQGFFQPDYNFSMSIRHIEKNAYVKVYPNPATDIINFLSEKTIQYITVYDEFGKLITKNTIYNQQFNMNEYAAGIYYITVLSDDNIPHNFQIIKLSK